MAQVGKQVVASQNFLNGLLSLPHYGELRLKQLERLLALISKSSLTLDQSGPIISSLDSRIWDGASLERLKSALADKTVEPGDVAETEGRVKQQDYSSLPRYLTEEWWLLLEKADSQASKEKALELVCDLAAKLGLRNGTEETYAFLLVLAFTMHPTSVVYDCEKQSLLQKWKPVMKRHLKKYLPLTSSLTILPEKVGECPAIYLRSAFPDGWTPTCPKGKSLTEVFRLGRTWPLRVSNVIAAAGKNVDSGNVLTQMTVSALDVAAAVARQTTLAISQQRYQDSLDMPGTRQSQESQNVASASSVLAILDKPPETCVSDVKPQETACDPQKMIDSLRHDLEVEKQDHNTGKNKKVKKPKNPSKGKKNLKRPAAAVAVLRRPAMSVPARQDSGQVPDPHRAALLSRIPKDVCSQFADGCSRCRYTKYCTISCWKRRGYT